MIKITPLRRTIRHLAQRLRMEGETFMKKLLACGCLFGSQRSNYTVCFTNRPCFFGRLRGSQDSQDERRSFGDGHRMFKMRRQRPISRDNRPLVGQDASFIRPDQHHWLQGDGYTRAK